MNWRTFLYVYRYLYSSITAAIGVDVNPDRLGAREAVGLVGLVAVCQSFARKKDLCCEQTNLAPLSDL